MLRALDIVIASASEAIHGAASRKNGLLRRVAPRNDGTPNSQYASAFSRRDFARVLQKLSCRSVNRGRRECRALNAPAASCVKKQTHELVTTVTPEITRHSPRNGFTAYFALSPVTRLV
jgi:hypothetical protein